MQRILETGIREYCLSYLPQERPLGFSPSELVFTHEVRGSLNILKESWLAPEQSPGLVESMSRLKSRLHRSCELARRNLVNAHRKMKHWYDKKARVREFKSGDRVLVLLPLHGQPLEAKFQGPCTSR